MQREGLGFRVPFALYGCAEHRGEVPLQFDSEHPGGWRHDDGVDQASECLPGFCARLRVLQRLRQRRHLLPIQLGHLGMEKWRRFVGGLQLCLELLPASVERLDFGFPLVHRDLVIQQQVQQLLDPRADPLDLALRGRETGASLHPKPIHFARELFTEFREELLVQELLLECLQHARFDFIPADGLVVVAASLIARAKASQPVPAGHDETGGADAALRQSREQVLRAPRAHGIANRSDGVSTELLALLRTCPQVVGHDSQLRDFFPHPLGLSIEPRDAFARVWIFDVTQSVPHEPTDVQFVVHDSCPALGASVDRAWAPGAAERTGNAFSVQILGDLLRRHARNEVAEDPFDDRRLGRFDLTLAGRNVAASQRLHDSIPVAQAAGGLAILDSSAQSTVCFLRQVLQEKGIHRALESDVQVGDVAFGKRDDVHAGKGQPLEQTGRVFLVSAEAVE